MVLFAKEKAIWKTMSRTEVPFPGISTTDDNGQWDAQMLALVGGDMPLIGIGEVMEDNLWDVERISFPTLTGQCRHWQQGYHHQENYRFQLFHYKLCFSKLQ
jgi:hypothetical protein